MNVRSTEKIAKGRSVLAFLFLISFALLADFPVGGVQSVSLTGDAEAVVGRPASPNSVAGVHRRTRRRARRRVALGTRVRVLPVGCTTVITRDVTYHSCGGVYYRPYYEGSTVHC